MSRVVQCFVGGKGTVRHGTSKVKGLRNKRRAHWTRERKMEDILAEKKAKAQALIDESYLDDDWDR